MAPAHERFAGFDLHGFEVDERLEVELEGVGPQRRAEVGAEDPAFQHLVVHGGLVGAPSAAAGPLGAAERQVGPLHQRFGARGERRRGRGHPEARRDPHRVRTDREGRVGGSDDAAREGRDLAFFRYACLEHQELVAAEPAQQVSGADQLPEPPRDLPQEQVPARVAQRIVDDLETVQADKVERAGDTEALGFRELGAHQLDEVIPVGDLRHPVETREPQNPVFGGFAVRGVLDQDHGAAVPHGLDGENRVPPVGEPRRDRAARAGREQGLGVGGSAATRRTASRLQQVEERAPLQVGASAAPQDVGAPLIADQDRRVATHHAQAVRHGVERRVEPLGQHPNPAVRRHGVAEHRPEAARHRAQRRDEGQDGRGQDAVGPAAPEQPAEAERDQQGGRDLHGRQARAFRSPVRNRRRAGRRGR